MSPTYALKVSVVYLELRFNCASCGKKGTLRQEEYTNGVHSLWCVKMEREVCEFTCILKNACRSGLGGDGRQVFFPFITQRVCCCQEPDGDNLADLIFVMV